MLIFLLIFQGVLQRLRLGSLFNPAAMMIALCQEKAVLHEVHLNQVINYVTELLLRLVTQSSIQ